VRTPVFLTPDRSIAVPFACTPSAADELASAPIFRADCDLLQVRSPNVPGSWPYETGFPSSS